MAVALEDAKTAMPMIHGVDSIGCEAVSMGGSIWKESIAEAAGPPDTLEGEPEGLIDSAF